MAAHTMITPDLSAFIAEQPLFFVASAPLAAEGHVNISPRGLDTFRVLNEHQVAWLDLTGSGNETAAHITENGRVTIMFCAFSGRPRVLRLHGHGRLVMPGTEEWSDLSGKFPDIPGARQIIHVSVDRVATSCGYGVPLMECIVDRDMLVLWAERKGEEGLKAYRHEHNELSIDGLPVSL